MDDTLKKLILLTSSIEGFLTDENKFIGLSINKERKKAIESIRELAIKVSRDKIKDNEINKLIKEIKNGDISVEVIRNYERMDNKRRMGRMTVKVNRGSLETICESAMLVCKNCVRNKKNCLLRTSLIKCNIEPYHDEEGICPYKQ